MIVRSLPGLLALCLAPLPQEEALERPPNIVIVLADDMGYGDVGAYNPDSKIPTPHMDALANEGILFTDAHSPSAVCTPTRYGLLCGRYCWRTWLKRGVVGGYTPPLIEPDRPTIASVLKSGGYRTAMIGKWHLGLGWVRANGFVGTQENAEEHWRGSWQDGDPDAGMNVDFSQPIHGGPIALGFDHAYFTAACSTIDGPFCYIENDRPTVIPERMVQVDRSRDADHRPRAGCAKVLAALDYDDQGEMKSFELKTDRQEVLIGRGALDVWVDLRLHTPADVSRRHALIRRDERDRFWIQDLSQYGTWVDGRQVPQGDEIELTDGALIDLAAVAKLRFRREQPPALPPLPVPPPPPASL